MIPEEEKQEKLRKKIKKCLLGKLKTLGIDKEQYIIDLINDYMALWDVKNALIADIKARGVSVEYQNGQNQKGYKRNDSISELNKTNAQMLKILGELGISANDIMSEAEDDTDDEM